LEGKEEEVKQRLVKAVVYTLSALVGLQLSVLLTATTQSAYAIGDLSLTVKSPTTEQTIMPGEQSEKISIQLNKDGVAVEAEDTVYLSLVSSSATGKFSGTVSWHDVTQIHVSEGNKTASFYYKDTTPGVPVITVSDVAGSFGKTTYSITVVEPAKILSPLEGAYVNSTDFDKIDWEDVDADGAKYNVKVTNLTTRAVVLAQNDLLISEVPVGFLADGNYEIKVESFVSSGEDTYNLGENKITITVDNIAPIAVENFNVKNNLSAPIGGSVVMTWSLDNTDLTLDRYNICWRTTDEDGLNIAGNQEVKSIVSSLTVEGLINDNNYEFLIIAVDKAGNLSPESNTVELVVADVMGPNPVTTLPAAINLKNLSAIDFQIISNEPLNSDKIEVQVKDKNGNNYGPVIILNQIIGMDEDGNEVSTDVYKASSFPKFLKVEGDFTFNFTVADLSGNETESSIKAKVDTLAPLYLANLKKTMLPNGVKFSWDPFASGQKVNIYRNEVFVAAVGGYFFDDTSLIKGQNYKYSFIVVDENGNESVPVSAIVNLDNAISNQNNNAVIAAASVTAPVLTTEAPVITSSTNDKKDEVKGDQSSKEIAGNKDENKDNSSKDDSSKVGTIILIIFLAALSYLYYRKRLEFAENTKAVVKPKIVSTSAKPKNGNSKKK